MTLAQPPGVVRFLQYFLKRTLESGFPKVPLGCQVSPKSALESCSAIGVGGLCIGVYLSFDDHTGFSIGRVQGPGLVKPWSVRRGPVIFLTAMRELTPGFLLHGFLIDRTMSTFGVWAAPAAHTPNIDIFR